MIGDDSKTEVYLQFECELQDAIDQFNNEAARVALGI